MPKPLRYAVAVLRYSVVVACFLVILASSVMWPRSYFYWDVLKVTNAKGSVLFMDFGNSNKPSGHIQQTRSSGHDCAPLSSIGGLIRIQLDGWIGDGYSWLAIPCNPRGQDWMPSVNREFLVVPYWLLAALATIGLVVSPPWLRRRLRASELLRFSVLDLLVWATLVAVAGGAYQAWGNRGGVIALQASTIGAFAWLLARRPLRTAKDELRPNN